MRGLGVLERQLGRLEEAKILGFLRETPEGNRLFGNMRAGKAVEVLAEPLEAIADRGLGDPLSKHLFLFWRRLSDVTMKVMCITRGIDCARRKKERMIVRNITREMGLSRNAFYLQLKDMGLTPDDVLGQERTRLPVEELQAAMLSDVYLHVLQELIDPPSAPSASEGKP